MKLSQRSDVKSFRALDNLRAVNARVAKGESIIRMEAGQPCFGAPPKVLDLARQNIQDDPIQGYTDAIGTQALREKISAYYRGTYGAEISAERVALATGSSCSLVLAFITAFNAGDTVALIAPTYPAYRNILKSLDINVIELQAGAADNYQPTIALLESAPQKFDGMVINSPNNPTGTMICEGDLREICQWCDANDVRLISDEAYHGVTYETKAQTALNFSSSAIVLNTFSKYFALTGWRLGWSVVPHDMVERIRKLSESLYVSPPTLSQRVAYHTLDHVGVLDEYVMQYQKNRDILREGLPDAGFKNLSAMQGAFYVYVDLSDLTDNSEEFCARMIDEAGVSATAGLDFDTARGHQTMRMSYAGTAGDMREACVRIKKWLS